MDYTLPAAIVGAAGSVLSAYVAVKVKQVATISNGRLLHVENELRLTRQLLDEALLRDRSTRK